MQIHCGHVYTFVGKCSTLLCVPGDIEEKKQVNASFEGDDFHYISYQIKSYSIISYHITSYHIIPYHFSFLYLISYLVSYLISYLV